MLESHVFCQSQYLTQFFHRYNELMVANTISCLVLFAITSNICRKSHLRTTTFPLNGNFELIGLLNLRISCMVISKASKQYLFIIGVSSQMIRLLLTINSARGLPYLMLQVESSFEFNGIANLEWAVLPSSRRWDIIPLDATFNTISPFDLKAVENAEISKPTV